METGNLMGVIALNKYMSPFAHEGLIKAEHQERLNEGLRQPVPRPHLVNLNPRYFGDGTFLLDYTR